MNGFKQHCRQALDAIRGQGRYRVFTPLQKRADGFPYYLRHDGSRVLVWSSNDYLAMGGHPVPVNAACEAARTMGAGAGGTRNISGTSPVHDDLEAELADLHGKQAGLLFTSGFVSNQAALSTILNSLPNGAGPAVAGFSDAKNHASMIAGIKGSRAVGQHFPSQRPGASGGTAACRAGGRAEADRLRDRFIRWMRTFHRSGRSVTWRTSTAR